MSNLTAAERQELDHVERQLSALWTRIPKRHVDESEERIDDILAALSDSPDHYLKLKRVTDADAQLLAKLAARRDAIINAGRQRTRAERQAQKNAREVAKLRAAACPECHATHAGEC